MVQNQSEVSCEFSPISSKLSIIVTIWNDSNKIVVIILPRFLVYFWVFLGGFFKGLMYVFWMINLRFLEDQWTFSAMCVSWKVIHDIHSPFLPIFLSFLPSFCFHVQSYLILSILFRLGSLFILGRFILFFRLYRSKFFTQSTRASFQRCTCFFMRGLINLSLQK